MKLLVGNNKSCYCKSYIRSTSYFIDEATGNLDEATAGEIIDVLKKLAKERNKCVIVVTHSKEVVSAADIILELITKN